MSRTVFALALLPFLAGCPSTSTLSGADRPVAVKPELARVPQALKQRCAAPSDIPERDIGSEEAARLWANDRVSLGVCASRHTGLVTAVEALEQQIEGGITK